MKKNVRIALTVLLALALAGILAYIVYRDMDRAAGVETYDQAAALAGVPDLDQLTPGPVSTSEPVPTQAPTPAPGGDTSTGARPAPAETPQPKPAEPQLPVFDALEHVDLETLRAYNQEVLGWIAIPGVLSYPLMQGQDNSFYLNHTWNGSRNSVGSVFMDYRCRGDMGDFNTVIYAHRTRRGAMFGSLSHYADQGFWAAHPDVYLVTDSGISRYRIYAAYEAELTGSAYYRQFGTAEGRKAFVSDGVKRSRVHADVLPTAEDRFLTLSTCTGNGHDTRWVVQAVRAED